MQLPNPVWYRRWSVILAGVIGLAAIVAMLGWRGLQQVASPAPTVTTQPPATVPPTVTAPPTSTRRQSTTTSRAPGVLWSKEGRDVMRSPVFQAPANWRIIWSFDCSNFKKFGAGNFKVTGDGDFRQVDIQKVDLKASGSRSVRGGGYGYLLIDSVCKSWTVEAVAG